MQYLYNGRIFIICMVNAFEVQPLSLYTYKSSLCLWIYFGYVKLWSDLFALALMNFESKLTYLKPHSNQFLHYSLAIVVSMCAHICLRHFALVGEYIRFSSHEWKRDYIRFCQRSDATMLVRDIEPINGPKLYVYIHEMHCKRHDFYGRSVWSNRERTSGSDSRSKC